jgi:hypothetical protein
MFSPQLADFSFECQRLEWFLSSAHRPSRHRTDRALHAIQADSLTRTEDLERFGVENEETCKRFQICNCEHGNGFVMAATDVRSGDEVRRLDLIQNQRKTSSAESAVTLQGYLRP